MTKEMLKALVNIVIDSDTEDKEKILAELDKEINRGSEAKAAKAQVYDAAWEVVRDILAMTTTPLTVAEITAEGEGHLPDGFGKGRVLYGLNHQWADFIVKIPGKVNAYALKA